MARVINTIVSPKYLPISVSSSGNNEIVPLVAGRRIKVIAAILVSAGTVSVKFRSASTDLSGAMPLIANSGFVIPESFVGWVVTEPGEALNLHLSGAVQVSGMLVYEEF